MLIQENRSVRDESLGTVVSFAMERRRQGLTLLVYEGDVVKRIVYDNFDLDDALACLGAYTQPVPLKVLSLCFHGQEPTSRLVRRSGRLPAASFAPLRI